MSYSPPYRYTDREFLLADIADIETDIRCVLRDHSEEPMFDQYVAECRSLLKVKREALVALDSDTK